MGQAAAARRPRAVLFAALVVAASAAHACAASARPAIAVADALPKARLTLSAHFVTCPAIVEARLVVREPGPAYECVAERWVWGDGSASEQAACDPGDPYIRAYSRRHKYRRAGRYFVTVALWNADGLLFTDHLPLEVRGGLGC